MALDRILAEKQRELAEKKADVSLERLRDGVRPSARSLLAALARPGATRAILECKKASPSRGVLRADFDPVAIACAYEGVADGISVLTDPVFFQGSLEHLRAVSEAVSIPVLRKDFILDPYQVYEARAYGADAVLLMLSVLKTDADFLACLEACQALGMDALVEVHDAAELARALALPVSLIGINNRNLQNLALDLSVTERLAPQIPADKVVICESGILSHQDIRRLRPLVNGFLVGSSLMERVDVDRAARELLHGRVKVCGLTRPEDVQTAFAAGASYGGLIFAEGSPRRVTLSQAEKLRAAAPLGFVGVFVNAPPDVVAQAAVQLHLVAVQLHGDETRGEVAALRALLPTHVEIWKAVRVKEGMAIPSHREWGVDRLLLDTYRPQAPGGTGERFDWNLVAAVPDKERLIVAGGLSPENAAEAEALGVFALDVNSGVESAPGVKDSARLRRFLTVLRGEGRATSPFQEKKRD